MASLVYLVLWPQGMQQIGSVNPLEEDNIDCLSNRLIANIIKYSCICLSLDSKLNSSRKKPYLPSFKSSRNIIPLICCSQNHRPYSTLPQFLVFRFITLPVNANADFCFLYISQKYVRFNLCQFNHLCSCPNISQPNYNASRQILFVLFIFPSNNNTILRC